MGHYCRIRGRERPNEQFSINSTTMRFSGYVPLLGGVYVTGKCEKVFRRTMVEKESDSVEFDQELREQGIELRP